MENWLPVSSFWQPRGKADLLISELSFFLNQSAGKHPVQILRGCFMGVNIFQISMRLIGNFPVMFVSILEWVGS